MKVSQSELERLFVTLFKLAHSKNHSVIRAADELRAALHMAENGDQPSLPLEKANAK